MYWKLSLEREVDQMVNDMMQKEGCTRSYALSVLRSKFESEERHQEVEYVNDLIQKEAEEQESELPPTATTTEEVVITNEPGATITTNEASKITHQKERQETVPSKSISKQ
jgi:hypothetical protein